MDGRFYDGPGSLDLETLVEPNPTKVSRHFELAHGASLDVDDARARLLVRGVGGDVQLTILLTADGPVLSFRSVHVELDAARSLRLKAETIELEAKRHIDIATLGSLSQRIAGDATTHCEGAISVDSGSASLTAHTGDLQLDSTHDLRVNGERVLVNC